MGLLRCVMVVVGIMVGVAPLPLAYGHGAPLSMDDARQLFAEALKDQQEERHQMALDKFLRVRDAADTPPVRYRIAVSLDALGRLVEAIEMYRSAAALGQPDPVQAKLVKASLSRADELEPRTGHLHVIVPPSWGDDNELQLDGKVVVLATAQSPQGSAVDPGNHDLSLFRRGVRVYQSRLTMVEGGSQTVDLGKEVAVAPAPSSPPPAAEVPAAPPASEEPRDRTLGWVSLGVGGGLVVGGLVSLGVRKNDIAHLEEVCPNNVCPLSQKDSLESTRSRALVLGPLGAGLLGVGLLGLGVGSWLVFAPSKASSSDGKTQALTLVPSVLPGGGGITIGGAL